MLTENDPIFEACLICLITKFFSISCKRRPFISWRSSLIFFLCDCALISRFLNLRRHLLKTVKPVICNLTICKKTLKFMTPSYGWGSNVFMQQCHFERDNFFYHSVPRISWHPFNGPRKDKRLSQTWSHPLVLNLVPMDWE